MERCEIYYKTTQSICRKKKRIVVTNIMKKLITSLICLFACAGLQARVTLHQSDFDQKDVVISSVL